MARVVLSGYMVRHPMAGNLFAFFHYALGLHRLGHDVLYIEEAGWPGSCYDPVAQQYGDDPQRGLEATRALFAAHDLPAPVWFFDGASGAVHGADLDTLRDALATADLLLDVGGSCWHPEFERCRRKVLIDLDPLFTQLGRYGGHKLDQYDVCFSYGGNIGQPGCPIPTCGVEWRPTVPPVVPDLWQAVSSGASGSTWTTVTNWRSYEPIVFRGQECGQKDVEFLRILDLPQHTHEVLELAISGAGARPRRTLEAAGWQVRDSAPLSIEVPLYQRYVADSRGEFSVAKHAYVMSNSGWFSDRSVCYLAAGRPVVLQDTGFSHWLETGQGVLSYKDLAGAARALGEVAGAYAEHSRAAARIAEEVFSYQRVLPPVIAAGLDDTRASHAQLEDAS
jgi:hypothetical protein